MRKPIDVILVAIVMLVFLGYYPIANAEEPLERRGKIIELEGSVEVKRLGSDVWRPAEIDMEVATGDLIRALEKSYVDISIEKIGIRNAVIRIREDSTASADISSSEVLVKIITGKVVFWARKIKGELDKFEIRTPNTIVGIEGSLGVVEYDKQSQITESWVKVAGGYVINMNSGEYHGLESGANYVEVKKRKTSIKRDFRPEKYSWDLSLFRRSYAFVTRGTGKPRVTYAREKYVKDYISGKYITVVDVTEGEVIVAPYDEEGPRFDEGFVLLAGMQASMEEEIGVRPPSPEEEEVEEVEEEEEKAEEATEEAPEEVVEEEEEVELELEEAVEESQKSLHQ